MKEVIHEFGVETDWVESMAKAMNGYVKENYIIVPDDIHTGTRYVLSINADITVLIADALYHQDMLFKLRNTRNDFIGIYFNLTEGESAHVIKDEMMSIGRFNYNLAIVDSEVDIDYLIKAGSKTYNFCIFIKKKLVKQYLLEAGVFVQLLDRIFDGKKNTIIHYDVMNSNCIQLIDEFHKIQVEEDQSSYDLSLTAVVYSLLGDYIDQLIKRECVISKLNSDDFLNIMESQKFLTSKIKSCFPGIKILAKQACMSETKYKLMYKKITGITPNKFHMNIKTELAKDLLISGQFSIGELADKLNYSSSSNLALHFKQHFDILPKDYIALMK